MTVASLKWRIISILLAVSLVPFGLLGVGAWVVFGRLLESKSLELQRNVVRSHCHAIESYLNERVHLLGQAALTRTLEEMKDPALLQRLLDGLNEVSRGGFTDLGVFDAAGDHLTYVGPFELRGLNYRDADWFKEVMAAGAHISDVFLGYRGVPHCVIAVKRAQGPDPWVLRATINSNQFDLIVRTGELGAGSDAFILDREGRYQTTPRVGSLLDRAPLPAVAFHSGIQESHVTAGGVRKIQTTAWLNGNRWLLVVRQDSSEVRAPVTRALTSGVLVMLLAFLLVVVTTVLATRHLTSRIEQANAAREEMVRAFTRSAKLASIGELATGLAHEINNPLAIISAEQTNIADVLGDLDGSSAAAADLRTSVERIKRQVKRCASITTKMLQFGRSRETRLELAEIGPRLQEIANLLKRQAGVRNVDLVLDAPPDLPRVMLDPVELEQVLVNLINNSFYAMPQGGTVSITARRSCGELILEVRDTGTGIPPEHLEKIFEPFFSTKPVGEGTGLGLSICYGLVRSWGGELEVESQVGRGTTVRMRLRVPEEADAPVSHGGET